MRPKTPERSLVRLSRPRFGVTPVRLYLRIRLQAARSMLFYEEFSIGEVAIACGFSYPSVFSRAFKQQFDKTPQTFRRPRAGPGPAARNRRPHALAGRKVKRERTWSLMRDDFEAGPAAQ